MKKETKLRLIGVRFEEDDYFFIKASSEELGVSMSSFIRMITKRYLSYDPLEDDVRRGEV